ncbi:hypothetical protein ZOSMA_14G01350 [Zostera marina]|uniref:Uncharacterized protein n=1 Tax=Zostera marina TaxID=29655 RepID=A0A0K9PYQ6_ZOSMR|nr:hypothetical protein ZOSMA_14G01350 [Zostera marina]
MSNEKSYDEGDFELNDNRIDKLRKGKSIVTHSEYSDIIDISSSSEIKSDKKVMGSSGASCSILPLVQSTDLTTLTSNTTVDSPIMLKILYDTPS